MSRANPVAAALIAGISTLFAASTAQAIPAFARKTGMACPACHDAWPRLTDLGEAYRDRGYRTGNTDDNSFAHLLDSVPISFRTSVGYQYTSTTQQATDSGVQTIGSGAFLAPVADVYFAMAMSEHVSVYSDIAGFSKDGTASLESAWARINDIGTGWLNLKVGKLEMDLPLSQHRSLTLFSPFLIYSYHPTGSSSGFNLAENQLAVEVMGHGEGPGLRYSVALATSGDSGSGLALGAPTVYGHLTYTGLTRSRVVPRVRIGLYGDAGWWPTGVKMLTPMGGMPAPVLGTGTDHRLHSHAGGDLQVVFGALARPITLSAVWMYGQEDAGLVANGMRTARFHGGFAQLDYTPVLWFTFGGRFDGVYNLQQADPTQTDNANQQEAASLFGRYAVWLSAWGSLVAHAELSTVNTREPRWCRPMRCAARSRSAASTSSCDPLESIDCTLARSTTVKMSRTYTLALPVVALMAFALPARGDSPPDRPSPATPPTPPVAPVAVAAPVPSPAPPPAAPSAAAIRGRSDYQRYCAGCHGSDGDGRGPSAHRFENPATDFTRAIYKCRSTAPDSPPTDDDLRRSIRHGLAGSGMPVFGALGPTQIDDLVELLKSYSSRFEHRVEANDIAVPPEPASGAASLAAGRELYARMQCATCHGARGHGGPNAIGLKNVDGSASHVTDFTGPNSLKCGERPAQIYRSLMAGLDGTPMASFAEGMAPDEAWHLVHYIQSLR